MNGRRAMRGIDRAGLRSRAAGLARGGAYEAWGLGAASTASFVR